MIDTLEIYNDLRESFGEKPATKMAKVIKQIYDELSQTVTKDDFNSLKSIVLELGKSQKELAEAQKRTEAKVEELAEAQKRTEARVGELAEAQKRTEAKVEELAEAQKRTQISLDRLVGEHRKTREQVGGLSHAVGYRLEDEAIWALPALLKRDLNMEVIGSLKRDFLEIGPGKFIEANIWGTARKNGSKIGILGEAKAQLKKSDVDAFIKHISKIEESAGMKIYPILITYQTSPQVRTYVEKKGIKLYFSYELRNKI